ncbi:hypothetical protein LIER_32192 [Lithospermum erythrorhizon]|uniref:Transmembrane protein 230 n=1 Tax=Lithospermum erythrorhizon TaxID=34254 RepID=A0AAV3RVC9_LITER
MASRRNVQYNRLALDDDDEYYGDGRRRHDPRFDYFPTTLDKVPLKSICIAIFLLALGCFVLLLSYFVFTGQMGGERDQAYGLLFIGIICIIPDKLISKKTIIKICKAKRQDGKDVGMLVIAGKQG